MNVIKLFHVLFVFVWIGALLSITRLMAYLVKEPAEVQARLSRICRRTYFFIDLPSMVLAIGFLGLSLLFLKAPSWKGGWLHMKLTFAFFLIVCDLTLARYILKLSNGPVGKKGRRFKVLHGLVGLFLIGVLVAIYILKPKI